MFNAIRRALKKIIRWITDKATRAAKAVTRTARSLVEGVDAMLVKTRTLMYQLLQQHRHDLRHDPAYPAVLLATVAAIGAALVVPTPITGAAAGLALAHLVGRTTPTADLRPSVASPPPETVDERDHAGG